MFGNSAQTAIAVAWAESQFQMVQSRERYTFSDPRRNITIGSQERSYCIFQIHAPDHDSTAKRLGYGDYRTNVESCVRMAYYLYQQRGGFGDWSVYNNGMYLAYYR